MNSIQSSIIPLVSVIIPNFNHANYLDERIQSVLNQSYRNFEVIILDDCSVDNSREIIEKYASSPQISQIIFNDQNSGSPFLQWKKGIKVAKGELIWLAESDDFCAPEFLNSLVLENSKYNTVLSFCRSVKIDVEGNVLPNPLQEKLVGDFVMDGHRFIRQYLVDSNSIENASSVIFKRDVAMSLTDEYTSYRGAGDWVFWLQLCLKGNVSFLNTPLNYYRWHGNNTSIQEADSGKQEKENKRVYDFLFRNGVIDEKQYLSIRKMKLFFILYNQKFDNKLKRELLELWDCNNRILIEIKVKKEFDRVKCLLGRILRKLRIR